MKENIFKIRKALNSIPMKQLSKTNQKIILDAQEALTEIDKEFNKKIKP